MLVYPLCSEQEHPSIIILGIYDLSCTRKSSTKGSLVLQKFMKMCIHKKEHKIFYHIILCTPVPLVQKYMYFNSVPFASIYALSSFGLKHYVN